MRGGAAGQRRGAVNQAAVLIDGARVKVRTRLLVDRHALPGDRRLVNAGAPLQHLAIQRDALTGAHAHLGTDRHLGYQLLRPAAISLQHAGLLRRECQQPANGIAGAGQRARFDLLGQTEQHHHHGRLGPLTNQHRPRHRDAHQSVDIQGPLAHRHPALAVGVQPTQRNGYQRQQGADPAGLVQPVADLRAQCQHAGYGQRPPGPHGRGRRRLITEQLRGKAQAVDGRQHSVQALRRMAYSHDPLQQVEVQLQHLRAPLQSSAQQALLGRTVHLQDTNTTEHTALMGLQVGGWRCAGSGAAAVFGVAGSIGRHGCSLKGNTD